MARAKNPEIKERDIQGLKYFKRIVPLLEGLHLCGTQRDLAGNRQLHYDQYAGLLLIYFFSPVVTSLRSIQRASALEKVQKLLGCSRVSLGSLSEAAHVFDPALLKQIIGELSLEAQPLAEAKDWKALEGLTAVDGTLLPALPKMAWALWVDKENRAVKAHVAFEVMTGIPVDVRVTEGNGSEKGQLRLMLKAGCLYVVDRGYAEYELFQEILDAGSSVIGRIRANAVWEVIEERQVSAEAKAQGVQRDLVVRLGGEASRKALKQPMRVVEVHVPDKRSGGKVEVLLLVTDRLDLTPELVALGYKFRWTIELFFRWFKRILGCMHLLSESRQGVEIQVYVAIIASLLLSIWTGRKPTKATLEMFSFYLSGWATEQELMAHLESLKKHAK